MAITDLLPPVSAQMNLALQIAHYFGFSPTVTSTVRTFAKQLQLRQQYEACLARGAVISPANPDPNCRYPANRPGESAHNYGLAFDSSVDDGYWDAWNAIRSLVGFTLDPNDRVHAEVPGWRAIAQLLIDAGWVDSPGSLNIAMKAPNSPVAPLPPPKPVITPPPTSFASLKACQAYAKAHPGFMGYCSAFPPYVIG